MSEESINIEEHPPEYLDLTNRLAEIYYLGRSATLLSWDEITMMPIEGRSGRAEQKAALDSIVHRLATRDEIGELLDKLEVWEATLPVGCMETKLLRLARRNYRDCRAIPSGLVSRMSKAASEGYHAWVKARDQDDFSIWMPYLESVTTLLREVAYEIDPNRNAYEVILQRREPGVTLADLSSMFQVIEERIIPIRLALKNNPPRNVNIAPRSFDITAQEQFTNFVLEKIGFNMKQGRVDTSVHPVSFSIHPEDVRLCVRTNPTDFRTRLFAALHEGGHGLFFQNVPSIYRGTPLDSSTAQGAALSPVFGGISTGLHEGQSRLWENMLGRSHEFWVALTPIAIEIFGQSIEDLDIDDLFIGVNEINKSPIRVEADEFSYDLHIILRYEIERGLLEGNLEVRNAPSYWQERSAELFERPPREDREGILQDMHWSRGGHGGFPSYTIGNVVGAQLMQKLRSDVEDYDDQIAGGEWRVLLEWMSENVHINGAAYGPLEMLEKVCGTPFLNASVYADYLEQKSLQITGER